MEYECFLESRYSIDLGWVVRSGHRNGADCVHAVYAELYVNWEKFRDFEMATLGAYVRILIRSELRKAWRGDRECVLQAEPNGKPLAEPHEEPDEALYEFLRSETRQYISSEWSKDKPHLAFAWLCIEGYQTEEIAKVLDLSTETVGRWRRSFREGLIKRCRERAPEREGDLLRAIEAEMAGRRHKYPRPNRSRRGNSSTSGQEDEG